MSRARPQLPLRIILLGPPVGVQFCLQRGRDELVQVTRSFGSQIAFDLTVDVGERAGGMINLLGPFAQGPRSARFVSVNSGTSAGQAASCWTRRAKIPLASISPAQAERALESADLILEAQIQGAAKDGGPACATAPLLGDGWTVRLRYPLRT